MTEHKKITFFNGDESVTLNLPQPQEERVQIVAKSYASAMEAYKMGQAIKDGREISFPSLGLVFSRDTHAIDNKK